MAAFGVYRSTSFEQPLDRVVPWSGEDVDYPVGVFDLPASSFVAPQSGLYFFTVSVGAPSLRQVDVRMKGAYPEVAILRRSNSQQGVDVLSRQSMISLGSNSAVYLTSEQGDLYSDVEKQTSFAGFSLTDAMDTDSAFFVARRTEEVSSGRMIFNQRYTLSPHWNENTNRFRCPNTGVYYFSFSSGLNPRRTARLQLQGASRVVELTRTNTIHNNYDFVSREVLLNCRVGDLVSVNLLTGESFSGFENQASFLGFQYKPRYASNTPIAWAAYRSRSLSSSAFTQLVTYDIVDVNLGNAFQNNQFRSPIKGIYYISLSAGALRQQPVNLNLRRNNAQFLDVYRFGTNHNGEDTFGHSYIIQLNVGDTLQVQAQENTGFYSDQYLQTSFFGFLIYPVP